MLHCTTFKVCACQLHTRYLTMTSNTPNTDKGSARRRCVWMDTLEPVEPVHMCKRYLAEQVSSCDLLQQCVDVANPKGGMLRSVILGQLDWAPTLERGSACGRRGEIRRIAKRKRGSCDIRDFRTR